MAEITPRSLRRLERICVEGPTGDGRRELQVGEDAGIVTCQLFDGGPHMTFTENKSLIYDGRHGMAVNVRTPRIEAGSHFVPRGLKGGEDEKRVNKEIAEEMGKFEECKSSSVNFGGEFRENEEGVRTPVLHFNCSLKSENMDNAIDVMAKAKRRINSMMN